MANIDTVRRATALLALASYLGVLSPVSIHAKEAPAPETKAASGIVTPREGGVICLGGARVEVPPGAVRRRTRISIRALDKPAAADEALSNATSGASGYSFGPHGMKFLIPVRIVLPFDPDLSGSEAALSNLFTYRYDEKAGRWERLPREGVDREACTILSRSDHFSDMINATLRLPEGPAPIEFDPNSIKSLGAANPSECVAGISAAGPGPFGSASFRIPLRLPPGRAGMTPELSLRYSSEGVGGIAGRGFDIELPAVTTDTRFGSPSYGDGDTYLLDGDELAASRSDGEAVLYRPRVERAFRRIRRYVEENWWEVTDKSGLVMEYGREEGWAGPDRSDRARIYVWYLTKAQDPFGNTIEYEYAQDGGYTYLTEIRYTGNDVQKEEGAFRVVFLYEDRDDRRQDCRGGFVSSLDKRLSKVDLLYRNEIVRSYRFGYEENLFGQSLLVRFAETDGSGNEFYAYGFNYYELSEHRDGEGNLVGYEAFSEDESWGMGGSGGLQSSSSGSAGVSLYVGVELYVWIPFLGKETLASFGIRGGFGSSVTTSGDSLADVNGDGLPDAVSRSGDGLAVYRNTGSGFSGAREFYDGIPGALDREAQTSAFLGASAGIFGATGALTQQYTWSEARTGFSDVDGDGYPDFLTAGARTYRRGTGSGFDESAWKSPAQEGTGGKAEEDAEYQKSYYVQEPLRKWRAYRSGVVEVTQRGKLLEPGKASADGLALKTYSGSGELSAIGLSPSTPGPIEPESVTLSIARGESLYFLADALDDERYDEAEWNIGIKYRKAAVFEDMADYCPLYKPPSSIADFAFPYGDEIRQLYDWNAGAGAWRLRSGWRDSADGETLIALALAGFVVPAGMPKEAFSRLLDLCDDADTIAQYLESEGTTTLVSERDRVLAGYTYTPETGRMARNENAASLSDAYAMKYLPALGEETVRSVLGYPGLSQGLAYSVAETDGVYACSEKAPLRNYAAVITDVPGAGQVRPDTALVLDTVDEGRASGETILLSFADDGNPEISLSGAAGASVVEDADASVETSADGKTISFRYRGVERRVALSGRTSLITSIPCGLYAKYVCPKALHLAGESCTAANVESPRSDVRDRIAAVSEAAAAAFDACYETSSAGAYVLRSGASNDEYAKVLILLDALFDDEDSVLDRLPGDPTGQRRILLLTAGELDALSATGGADLSSALGIVTSGDGTEYRYIRLDAGVSERETLESAMTVFRCDEAVFPYYDLAGSVRTLKSGADAKAVEAAFASAGFSVWTRVEHEIVYRSTDMFDVAEGALPSGAAEQEWAPVGDVAAEAGQAAGVAFVPAFDEDGRSVLESRYIHLFDSARDYSPKNLVEVGPEFEVMKTPSEPFAGGIMGWYYGVWSGRYGFSESLLSKEPPKTAEGKVQPPPYFCAMDPNQSENGEPRIRESGMKRAPVSADAWVGPVSEYSEADLRDDGSLARTTYTYAAIVQGDRCVPARNGGEAYWAIPKDAGTEADTLASLRKSRSSTLDVNGGLSLAGFGASLGHSEGVSWQYRELLDMNGDRYPDLVRFDDGKGGDPSFSVMLGTGTGFGESRKMQSIFPHLRYCANESWVFGASAGAASGAAEQTVSSRGNVISIRAPDPKGEKTSFGASVQGSFGSSFELEGFLDINGDGLPDHTARDVGSYAAALNLGGAALSPARDWGGGIALALFAGGAAATAHGLSSRSTGSYGGAISGSYTVAGSGPSLNIGYSATVNRTHSGLYDVNGDGLPDEVAKDGNEPFFRVRMNLGDRFAAEELRLWRPEWSEDPAAYLLSSLASDLAALYSSFGIDIPGMSLEAPGYLPGKGENQFSDLFDPFDVDDVLECQTGVSYSFGASVTIFVPLTLLAVTIVPGFDMSVAQTSVTLKFMDIDGDSLPDHVLKLPGRDHFLVRRNLTGRIGLLKTVNLPQGGSYRFEYKSVGNTPDLPHRRWVMSAMTCFAGNLPSDRGASVYKESYAYSGGYYDRAERMFYGFSSVTATRADGATVATEYHNRDMWLKGIASRSVVADARGKLLAETVIRTQKEYVEGYGRKAVYFPSAIAEETRTYDPESGVYAARRMEYEYDIDTGNVTVVRDLGDPDSNDEDLSAAIGYASLGVRFRQHPESIVVTDASGAVLRRRAGSYGDHGELVALDGYYEDARYARHTLSWDEWGNLASVTDPRGSRTAWRYDDEVHAHAVSISRGNPSRAAYSLVTSSEWDYRLGKPLAQTDANGRTMCFAYDAFGRISAVYSPYDDRGGTPAVRYEYDTSAYPWAATAYNKILHDQGDSQTLRTVVFVDGLGRALQTAKEGECRGASGAHRSGWNLSGAVAYDDMGRVAAEGQPVFSETDGLPGLGELARPTKCGYDSLDRPVLTMLPDGAIIKVKYGVADGLLAQTTIDPLGNMDERQSDARGNTLTVTRKNSSGTILTTASYRYDALGRMLEAVDARGAAVTVGYDLAGRRTSLASADTGTVWYAYDESGNIVKKTDSVLRVRGESIQYEYDGLNRLIKIDYPRSADAAFEYGTSGTAENAAGRLVKRVDQSGVTTYTYGELGETKTMTRTIDRLTPLAGSEAASFSYEWDYLGRMQSITYPDGEVVAYGYDKGGRIKTVTGKYGGLTTEYVKDLSYDAAGQRKRIEYGNGVATEYSYDEDRLWLSAIRTQSASETFQNMQYSFDVVGNVLGYTNSARAYATSQSYVYDSLYQLTSAQGTTTYKPYGAVDYTSAYRQTFAFDEVGNLTRKTSRCSVSPSRNLGGDLNYSLAYTYYGGKDHQPETIGGIYYTYDVNGNVTEAREGGHGIGTLPSGDVYRDGDVRYTDYGFGLARTAQAASGTWSRYYVWDEENRLKKSVEGDLTVQYRYGADGQRAIKYSSDSETLYFDSLWQATTDYPGLRQSKHVYVGRTRVATRLGMSSDQVDTAYAQINTYYYHPDHLGSAQLVTDYRGGEYERIEYAPYGELWVEKTSDSLDKIPFRFTGKELDGETGLYYYGARYLDPKASLWISADPALGEYIPSAPVDDDAHKRNQNLPGMGGVYNLVNLHLYHYAGNNPVKYTDPDGRVIKPFTSNYVMGGESAWANKPVGNSSNIPANYMRNIGCAVTGCANLANTLLGSNITPLDVNRTTSLFSLDGTDDDKSNIYFDKFADSKGLLRATSWTNFSANLKYLDSIGTECAVLAQVLYKEGDDKSGHYVGVNGIKTIRGVEYIEIAPTSGNDSVKDSRRKDWLFQDGKTYVPVSDIKRLEVFYKKEGE